MNSIIFLRSKPFGCDPLGSFKQWYQRRVRGLQLVSELELDFSKRTAYRNDRKHQENSRRRIEHEEELKRCKAERDRQARQLLRERVLRRSHLHRPCHEHVFPNGCVY
eukprot:TRINITY_DN15034_c0_g3_i3.p1 TRINITY_DN15034_c0_g3~~TRINITY_DN15034_c0_g3_i3.p1  ORF type:complete len:108 (+),score=25.64 TRINITY_DN15034_c0_g3_i3:3-326(+)